MTSSVWEVGYPTHHLHKSHNTPLLAPKNLHRHCFRLLLGHFHVPGEITNNGYAKVLGGVIEMYYGIEQVVNCPKIWSFCSPLLMLCILRGQNVRANETKIFLIAWIFRQKLVKIKRLLFGFSPDGYPLAFLGLQGKEVLKEKKAAEDDGVDQVTSEKQENVGLLASVVVRDPEACREKLFQEISPSSLRK